MLHRAVAGQNNLYQIIPMDRIQRQALYDSFEKKQEWKTQFASFTINEKKLNQNISQFILNSLH